MQRGMLLRCTRLASLFGALLAIAVSAPAQAAPATVASCPDADVMPSGGNVATVVGATLCLLNGERADVGLPPLAQNARLASAALAHSREMVDHGYFAHEALDGSSPADRIRATGYIPSDRAWTVGENLAWGTGTLATPRNIVIAWMNSQGHRENILRPVFDEIGFGIVVGNPLHADGLGATYATTFGSLGAAAAPATRPVSAAPAAATAKPAKRSASRATTHRRRARHARAARRHRAHAAKARSARRHAHRHHRHAHHHHGARTLKVRIALG